MIHAYNKSKYNFLGLTRWALGVDDLASLHRLYSHELFGRENDQSTPFHKRFYDNLYCLEDTYKRFIREFITPIVGEDIIYQRVPSFRVHLVGNVAVGEEHKDSDYSHPTTEINFWLPLTPAFGTNTIWVEGEPQELNVGEVLEFDGANKMHGNKTNIEPYTRVSFDFRVIPKSKFTPSERQSINTKLKMDIGGYYEAL